MAREFKTYTVFITHSGSHKEKTVYVRARNSADAWAQAGSEAKRVEKQFGVRVLDVSIPQHSTINPD
jgi:hypothetical protein